MSTIILTIIFSAVALCFSGAAIVSINEARWKADIQTFDGKKKLEKIAYEKLELVRYRKKNPKGSKTAQNNLQEIPLTDPMPQGRMRPENWQSINKISTLDFSHAFTADIPFDILRLYGFKNGEKHTVFNYDFYPENYEDLKNLVDEYNRKITQQEQTRN